MITVGIRNLRNSLSKYIELAKNGETILITDHNKIVAEIVSPGVYDRENTRLLKYTEEQSILGLMIKSSNKLKLKKERTLDIPKSELTNLYNETRDERI